MDMLDSSKVNTANYYYADRFTGYDCKHKYWFPTKKINTGNRIDI